MLILVDEVQANSAETRHLVAAYQELVGEQADIALVMAGLPSAISETLNDRVLTFLNRARRVELSPLATSDVDAFFARSFDQLGIDVSEQQRQRAVEATYGSPYMLQLVGHAVVAHADDDGTLSDDALERALASARKDFENDICKTALAALSDQDVAFLAAMARDKGCSRMANVASRMGVTPDYAQKYRRRLIDAGIIEATRRGSVGFAVPYLSGYLAESQGNTV